MADAYTTQGKIASYGRAAADSTGAAVKASYGFAKRNPNTILWIIAALLIIAGFITLFAVPSTRSELQRSNQRLTGALIISLGVIVAAFAYGRANCSFAMPSFS